jgi:DNA-directed RNA polymerase subunit RPC12/RpoP
MNKERVRGMHCRACDHRWVVRKVRHVPRYRCPNCFRRLPVKTEDKS